MTGKADYTDEEWAALTRAPIVAGFAITLADPGGPIEITKESLAAMKTAATPPSDDELLVAVSQAAVEQRNSRQNPIKDIDLKAKTARQQIVDDLKNVNAILTAKATPEEAATFRAWLIDAAQEAANAAKEGGFFGIGATRVSEGEERMLSQLREIFGVEKG